MIHWIWISLLSGISVLLLTLYINLGGYKEVTIEIKNIDGMHLVYKSHVGPYHKINPTIEAVEKWAHDSKIECLKAFGEYLDKPGTIEDDRLRSHGGCVVPEQPENPLPEEFEYRYLDAQKVIYAIFKGAPSIGPIFVYPKIEQTLEEKKLTAAGPVLELYNTPNAKESTTEYLCLLKHKTLNKQ
ncbi:MAG: GyrI-like domain-containing protein [Bdellovibrionales bacterium]|nr:GyrI-like domain-containing protein [Bdellovibrionales bacterium]